MMGTYFTGNKRLLAKLRRRNRRTKREEIKLVVNETCNSEDLMKIMDQVSLQLSIIQIQIFS